MRNSIRGQRPEGANLKKFPEILSVIVGFALAQAAPAASATLSGETLDAKITITGQDHKGPTCLVLVGPVVVGASGFSEIFPFSSN